MKETLSSDNLINEEKARQEKSLIINNLLEISGKALEQGVDLNNNLKEEHLDLFKDLLDLHKSLEEAILKRKEELIEYLCDTSSIYGMMSPETIFYLNEIFKDPENKLFTDEEKKSIENYMYKKDEIKINLEDQIVANLKPFLKEKLKNDPDYISFNKGRHPEMQSVENTKKDPATIKNYIVKNINLALENKTPFKNPNEDNQFVSDLKGIKKGNVVKESSGVLTKLIDKVIGFLQKYEKKYNFSFFGAKKSVHGQANQVKEKLQKMKESDENPQPGSSNKI